LIFPPLGEEAERRSVWRETKFIMTMLRTGIMSLADIFENFIEIARLLLTEKRLKPERKLQLTGLG
jgi:hypothetical protein